MPTIKDKARGKVVAELPYNQQGEEQAKEIDTAELQKLVTQAKKKWLATYENYLC